MTEVILAFFAAYAFWLIARWLGHYDGTPIEQTSISPLTRYTPKVDEPLNIELMDGDQLDLFYQVNDILTWYQTPRRDITLRGPEWYDPFDDEWKSDLP